MYRETVRRGNAGVDWLSYTLSVLRLSRTYRASLYPGRSKADECAVYS